MSNSLLVLRDHIKKDPKAYVDEYLLQLKHLESTLEVLKHNPGEDNRGFKDLLQFVAHVSGNYKSHSKHVPPLLIQLLEQQDQSLHPSIRKQLVTCLLHLRNHDLIEAKVVLPCLFKLFRIPDKELRTLIHSHIVADITRMNQKSKNASMNRSLQNFMFAMLKDTNKVAAKKALDILIQLYRRSIWNDDRTMNVIAKACFTDDTKMLVASLQFLLGTSDEQEQEEKEEEEDNKRKNAFEQQLKVQFQNSKAKKTKKRQKAYEKAVKKVTKATKNQEKHRYIESLNAIHMLNDPHTFSEHLFGKLKSTNERFDVRIMMMDVISRCIIAHKLILYNFYPFLQKYMEPHQQHITRIMAIAAQSTHELVPEETLLPLVMTVANHFVNDRSKPESITAGLNTIREICSRQPRVMKKTLLRDLAQYGKHKNKMVFHAARGIIQLYRELGPKMLKQKDRGKNADLSKELPEYGVPQVSDGVEGIELLEQFEQKYGNVNDNPELLKKVQVDDEDSDDGGWVDIQHSDDEDLANLVDDGKSDEEENDDDVAQENNSDQGEDDDEDEDAQSNNSGHIPTLEDLGWEIDNGGGDDDDEEEQDVSTNDGDNEEVADNSDDENLENPKHVPTLEDLGWEIDTAGGDDDDDDEEAQDDDNDAKQENDDDNNTDIQEQQPKPQQLSQSRVLTDREFELLNKLKLQKQAKNAMTSVLGKRKRELVTPEEIQEEQGPAKRRKIQEDAEGNKISKEKWKHNKKKHGTGKTHKEKRKNKPFMMTKMSHKVKTKVLTGTHERKVKKDKSMAKELKFSLKH